MRINGHGHILPEPFQIPKFMKDKKLFWIDEDKKFMRQGDWSRPINGPGFFVKEKLEWKLIKKLLKFDEVVISIERDLMPNRLCNYLFELCQIFNRFYDQLPILKAESKTIFSRLLLCSLTEKTLKLSLDLLGIESLERM